jgi:hypothetical protein
MRPGWRRWVLGLVAAGALLVPLPAHADLGIPVGAVFWPAAWVLFLPVVLVEAAVARFILKLPYSESFRLSLRANTWSTVAGVPLACLLMLVIGIFFGPDLHRGTGVRWLGDLFFGSAVWAEGVPDWALYAGPALICLPCYLLSVRIEAWSAAKTVQYAAALRWARIANRITYGVLVAILVSAAALTGRR